MRFTDFALTESDMSDIKSDVEELVINKIESGVQTANLDAFVEEINELGIPISKAMLRLILESDEFQPLITNVSDSEIESIDLNTDFDFKLSESLIRSNIVK